MLSFNNKKMPNNIFKVIKMKEINFVANSNEK